MLKKDSVIKNFTVLFLVFFCLNGVWAQDAEDKIKEEEDKKEAVNEEKPMELDNIIVAATRDESTAFDTANSAVVVDNEDILRSQATSMADLLEDIPNVDFDNSSAGPIERYSLRGLDQDEIIVKVDGVRQTYQAASGIGASSAPIDPSLIKEVEVVRGAASVLHGSGGIGGVITMETVDAADLLKEGENKGVSLRSGYSSALEEYTQVVSVYGRSDYADFIYSGSVRNYGEYKSSSPDSKNDSVERDGNSVSALAKLSLFPDEDQDLSLSFNVLNDALKCGSTVECGTDQQRVNFSYNIFEDNGLVDFHLSSQYVNRINKYDNGVRDLKDDFHSIGIDAYNNFSGAFVEAVTYDITVGGDASFDHQEGTDAGNPDSSRPDADAKDLGAFARFDLGIYDKVHIIPAARYSYYVREANESVFDAEDQKESRLSPQIAVQLTPFEWVNVYGSYAETFRAPTMDEIYFEMDWAPYPIRVVANPDLDPEVAKTYEAGIGFKFDNIITKDDAFRAKAVVFTETVEDFISASPDFTMNGGIMEYTNINTGEVKRTGFELDSGIRVSNYSVDVAYGIIKGEDQDDKDKKTGSVPQNVTVRLGAAVPKAGLAFFWKSKFVDESDYTLMGGSDDAYNVHGAGMVWKTAEKKSAADYRVDLAVNNIFDEEYETYRGSTGPARDVRVSCTASF